MYRLSALKAHKRVNGLKEKIRPLSTKNLVLVQFKNVFKRFGTSQILKGVNLSIFKGEITTIVGMSGIGKTVLLKHIIGLLEPDSGEIFLAETKGSSYYEFFLR